MPNTEVADEHRVRTALEFLKDEQGFNVGGLYLSPRENEIWVVGQTNYNDPDNLTKSIALEELNSVKHELNHYFGLVPELREHLNERDIRYCLAYDYGMGGIELCNEQDGKIHWTYDIKD